VTGRSSLALGAAALALSSCAALDWLAEPACPCPPGRARLEIEPVPGGSAPSAPAIPGAILELPERPHSSASNPPRPAPSRGEIIARGAGRVGGIVTGNPIAWTLAGQLVAAGAAQISRRRRKDSTA
jgi:hypothetical protein